MQMEVSTREVSQKKGFCEGRGVTNQGAKRNIVYKVRKEIQNITKVECGLPV